MKNFATQHTEAHYRGKIANKGKYYRPLKVWAYGRWVWVLVDPDGYRYAEGLFWETKAAAIRAYNLR